jgi:hypothetical protein
LSGDSRRSWREGLSIAPGPARRLALITTACALLFLPGPSVQAQQDTVRVNPPGRTCEAGAISGINVVRGSVFDPDSTNIGVLAWTYRLMNVVHIRTQESFIRREILLREGQCFDEFLATESERLLESYSFLTNARVTSQADGGGGRLVTVSAQDEWSTQVDVGVTYDGGPNLEKFEVTEENFLGQGIFAEFTHRSRLETRTQSVRVSTPRLFGRTDASIEVGRDRPGSFFNQYIRYPFIGETGRFSIRQGYSRGTSFYSYGTPAGDLLSQVVAPQFREVIEFSAAQRFGGRGRSVIAGLTLSRDVTRFGVIEAASDDNLDNLVPYPGGIPSSLARQVEERAGTRVWLHLGARQIRFQEYFGIDALRDRLLVGHGYFLGASVGRGFGVLIPDGATGADEFFGRANASFTAPLGTGILHGGAYLESRRADNGWEDVLADAELVAYLRNDGLPGQTFFLRASVAGGWDTTMPYQMSLGGREGLRALPEDRYPGGRTARFVFEDRIVFPWPPSTLDLGMTLFAEVGRVWPGDAPFGIDSGWRKGVGAGVRIGFPRRARHAWRADLAFPVDGPETSPILRITFEVNRLGQGFFTPDHFRSRRFDLGAHSF